MKPEIGTSMGVLRRTGPRRDAGRFATRTRVERPQPTRRSGRGWSEERIWRAAVLAVATSIVYGSLVPFDFRPPDGISLGSLFADLQLTPWSLMSASDVLVNVAVGVPLGFAVMGVLRAHRRVGALATLATVLLVGCIAAILGVAVELLQALSATRRSSWNDVSAQAVGAAAGAVIWGFAGGIAVQWMRNLGHERTWEGVGSRFLQLYLVIYVALQLTPSDNGLAAEIATKYSTGQGALMPSVDSIHPSLPAWTNLAGSGLLTIPIGGLAVFGWVGSGSRRPARRAFLLGATLVAALIVVRYLAWESRLVTELVVDVLGVGLGVAAASAFPHSDPVEIHVRQSDVERRWILAAAAWIIVLIVRFWYPFDFALTADIVTRRLSRISFAPFGFYYWYAAYVVNPLGAVHETLLNFVGAVPLGLLLRFAWSRAGEPVCRRLQTVAATATAISVLIAMELGQAFLPARFPDVTDALVGISGAGVGIAMAAALVRRMTIAAPGIERGRRM